jgi:ABC-type nitrate/sulfonate/bicarbonate transport system substrate-binding protein
MKFKLRLLALAAVPLLASPSVSMAQDLRVGAATNIGGMVVFVAQDKGFFAKNGINAKVVTRNSGPALTKSLRAGEIDFAPAAFTNLPAALERGMNLRGVVGYVGSSYSKSTSDRMIGIATRPGTGIKTIADLKGRKVGVAFGGTGDLYLRMVLARAGMKTSDIKRINVRPPSFVSIFDSGGVEAITAWEPAFTRLLDKVKGATVVVRGGDYVCFCAVLHGTPEKIYGDRKRTQKFVDAMAEAASFVRNPANADEVAQIGSRFVRGMTPALVKRTMKHVVYDPRLGANTSKAFNFSVKQLIAQKKMKKPYDPSKYLEMSFITSTIKRHPEWFSDLPSGS